MLNYKVFHTIQDEELREAWLRLQVGSDMTAFQYYDWNYMLAEEFNQDPLKRLAGEAVFFLVLKDNEPILIAPLHIQKATIKFGNFGYRKGIYFLGMRGYSDYLNYVYKELSAELLDYTITQIKAVFKQKHIILDNIKDDTTCAKELKNAGYLPCREEGCVSIALPEEYEVYRAALSKNLVSNLKKQKNRYERMDFAIDVRLIEGTVDDEVAKKVAVIHNDRFQEKNKKNASVKLSELLGHFRKKLDEVQFALCNNEHGWLLIGMNRGEIVAYFYGLRDRNAVRIMQLGFDRNYKDFMPGNITLLSYIQQNYSECKNSVLDFTRGEERYKYELGGKRHLIYGFCI